MIRRNKIALSASICLVLATGSVSALTLVTSTNSAATGAENAAGANGPGTSPVTVYDDKYIDDLVYLPPTAAAAGSASPAAGGGAPLGTAANDSQSRASDGSILGSSSDAPLGAEGAQGAAGQPSPEAGRSTSPTNTDNPNPPQGSPDLSPANPSPAPDIGSSPQPVPTTSPPRTTIPPGVELPSDWPSGVPYPPLPAGCKKPHLEDNGVWNCEH
ncbi:unannotated protein [freshwater metagenome]|uniref:Unannotated protein n=1 Tax=freshwater metagenome TaxID=449393 RepID=A0A6J7FXZ7_9ZZZZ|nr:hypothetical protein [Actinomycetota bacterium]